MNSQTPPSTSSSTTNLSAASVQDPLLTSAETCEALKISRPTLHRYVRQKRILPRRLPGGQLRFNQSEVLALLA
jgi:excisionase family DNA binding protein